MRCPFGTIDGNICSVEKRMSLRTSDRCLWCGPLRGFPPVTIRFPLAPTLGELAAKPTERAKITISASGTSPRGRGKALIHHGCAMPPIQLCNCHWQLLDFDSLRGAPPRRGRLGERIATSAYGLLAKTYVLRFCAENRTIPSRYPIAHRIQTSLARIDHCLRQLRKKFTFIRFTPWEKCGTLTSNIVFYGGTP